MTLISPLRVWLIFNALFVSLAASSWYTLYRQAQADNQRLVASQAVILTKSRFEDIKNRRFRDFVEGVGREFSDLHVRLNIADETYQFGKPPSSGHCSDATYALGGGGAASEARVTICRPFRFSTAPLLAVLLVYVLISGLSLLFVRRLERRTTEALVEFLRNSGVAINSGRDLIGIMADMRGIRQRLDQAQAQERQLIDTRARAELAEQVAHDIRSPLTALEAAAADMAALSEMKRLQIRSALARIRDIANGLLERRKTETRDDGSAASGSNSSPQPLSSLIEPVVSEKRLALGPDSLIDVKSSDDAGSCGLFVRADPVEFKRVLSNLINNAVEALVGNSGTVRVTASALDGQILIAVNDDGKGMPPDVLAKLGQRGASFGKAGGSGLGLHHARASAEGWGGRLEIASEISEGTTVTLVLPSAPAPCWFVPEIAPARGGVVVILDDEEGIHQVWRNRLNALGADGQAVDILDFFTPQDIRGWVKENPSDAARALYLLDHDLSDFTETGLSLASELGLERRTILVTGRHDDVEVLEECRKLGIRLLPKESAPLVPIRVDASIRSLGSEARLFDAVLIDDDPLTRLTWENAASEFGKKLRAYSSPVEFMRESGEIDRRTPVYMDVSLPGGMNGAEVSLWIHSLGFSEIYLASGHPPEKFSSLKHLRAVVGKEPPWSA